MRLHAHKWEFVSSLYQPRPNDLRSFSGATNEVALRLAYGQTVVRQRCVKCGWNEYRTIEGKI